MLQMRFNLERNIYAVHFDDGWLFYGGEGTEYSGQVYSNDVVDKSRWIYGPGWVDAIGVILPEPDRYTDNGAPSWDGEYGTTYTAWIEGIESESGLNEGGDLEDFKHDTIARLSALAAHYQMGINNAISKKKRKTKNNNR